MGWSVRLGRKKRHKRGSGKHSLFYLLAKERKLTTGKRSPHGGVVSKGAGSLKHDEPRGSRQVIILGIRVELYKEKA